MANTTAEMQAITPAIFILLSSLIGMRLGIYLSIDNHYFNSASPAEDALASLAEMMRSKGLVDSR